MGMATAVLSGCRASTTVVVWPAALVVVRVVMVVGVDVDDDEGSLLVVVGAWEVFVEPEEDVLVGMMVARDGGRVVCPEVKTAHAPDKTSN